MDQRPNSTGFQQPRLHVIPERDKSVLSITVSVDRRRRVRVDGKDVGSADSSGTWLRLLAEMSDRVDQLARWVDGR
jgi:hypothetical protein